jgi:hypothetical protein
MSHICQQNRPFGRFCLILFLDLLEGDALAESRVVFLDLDFALHFLAVFARKVNVVGLGRLKFYKVIL